MEIIEIKSCTIPFHWLYCFPKKISLRNFINLRHVGKLKKTPCKGEGGSKSAILEFKKNGLYYPILYGF